MATKTTTAPAPRPTATQEADRDRTGARQRTAAAKARGTQAKSGQAPTRKATPAKPTKPVEVTTETVKAKVERPACRCGCGETTSGGSYRPGHDARHAGKVGRAIAAGGDPVSLTAALPTEALVKKALGFAERMASKPEDRAERAAKAATNSAADATARAAIRAIHTDAANAKAAEIASGLPLDVRNALLAHLALGL